MYGAKMKNEITLNNILNIYEKEISKNVKNKRKIYQFEANKIQNVSNIITMLNANLAGHNQYNIFLIYEPKCRLVMSLSVKDKIINHFLTRYCLERKLTKYLDERNCATRKGMGTEYAIKKVIEYIEKNKKYKQMYCLKIDIKKYFYTIDHDILKSLLIDKLDEDEYDLICKIIDSTNKPYINETIDRITKDKNIDIPRYEYKKGLPIGNMTSQFLSIYYLYKLDHFIIHDLKLKHYVRYMDDFIIISPDLEKLKKAKELLKEKLWKEYRLLAHEKKTMIVNVNKGFSFLGYTFKVINHKTIIRLKRSNLEKIKKRVKEVKYRLDRKKMNYNGAFCSLMTYQYCYKFCDNIRIKHLISRYFYNEE